MERKLVNGFYEDEVEKTEDELITEVCAKNKYTVITKSINDVVLFKDSHGSMVAILKKNLAKHTKDEPKLWPTFINYTMWPNSNWTYVTT
jgi:hypothetical protein